MRQGQNNNNNNNNKRTRGRGRKPQSSANRTYDSNGPDVKIRGSAAHVAEKYVTLARDAQVSGDRIASENYLQHAEHYFRIIAAAQAQNASQAPAQNAPQAPGSGDQPSAVNGQGRGHGNPGNRDEASQSAAGKRNEQPVQRSETESVQDGNSSPDAVSADGNDNSSGDGEAAEPSRPPRRTRTRRPRPPVAVADSEGTETSTPPAPPSEASAMEPSGGEETKKAVDDDTVVAEAG